MSTLRDYPRASWITVRPGLCVGTVQRAGETERRPAFLINRQVVELDPAAPGLTATPISALVDLTPDEAVAVLRDAIAKDPGITDINSVYAYAMGVISAVVEPRGDDHVAAAAVRAVCAETDRLIHPDRPLLAVLS